MSLTQSKILRDRAKLSTKLGSLGANSVATRSDNGVTLTVSRTKSLSMRQINDAGWQDTYQFTIRANYEDATDLTSRSTTITLDGIEYQILRNRPDTIHVWTMLDLGNPLGQQP